MKYLNITCPPLPYFVVGGECVFRPGDLHERRVIRNAFDFIYVRSGQLYLQQNNMDFSLNAGQFLIIFPGSQHTGSRICTEKTTFTWLHFYTEGSYFYSDSFHFDHMPRRASPKYYYSKQPFTLSLPQTGRIPEPDRAELEKYMQLLKQVSNDRYTGKKEFLAASRPPYELQAYFTRFLEVFYAPYSYTREESDIAKRMHDYFDNHYMEDVSLKRLAKEFSYSASHLIRCFDKAYRMSPMQYLMQLRLQKAAQLLISSNASVQAIGEEIGLNTPSYFIKQFKKATGYTPAQYRAEYPVAEQRQNDS